MKRRHAIVALLPLLLWAGCAKSYQRGGYSSPTIDPRDVVRASRLELVDDRGRVRAVLGINVHDSPALMLYDRAGNARLEVALGEEEMPAIHLYDSDGAPRVVLNGMPGLTLANPRQELGIGLVLNDGEYPMLLMCSGRAPGDPPDSLVSAACLEVDEKRIPRFGLVDSNGRLLFAVPDQQGGRLLVPTPKHP